MFISRNVCEEVGISYAGGSLHDAFTVQKPKEENLIGS